MLMHESFTRKHRLDNLIWVLGWAAQSADPAYYPSRRYVDVAGADIDAEDRGNLASMFGQVRTIVGETLPICLHENGPIPDPATLGLGTNWLWFLTWHTRWLKEQTGADRLRDFYASDRYLTRDELPRR